MAIERPLTMIALLSLLALAGCDGLFAPAGPSQPSHGQVDVTIYCYRTLADPDCYDHPQGGAERRFIGAYH